MYSQNNDTTKTNFSFSINALSSIMHGEISPYLEIKNSKNYALEVSFGKIYKGFNWVYNSGYIPTNGIVMRVGVKRYSSIISKNSKVSFGEIRYTYKNLNTAKYCTHESAGLSESLSEIVQDEKNTHKITSNYGAKIFFLKHLFLELSIGAGFNCKLIKRNMYSWGTRGQCYNVLYPEGEYRSIFQLWPTIETGIKIGLRK